MGQKKSAKFPTRFPCEHSLKIADDLLQERRSASPKRGCLNVGGLKPAGKRQESATFLRRSFFEVAVQFFICCSAAFGRNDFHAAEKRMLQCNFCSAALRKLRFPPWRACEVEVRYPPSKGVSQRYLRDTL